MFSEDATRRGRPGRVQSVCKGPLIDRASSPPQKQTRVMFIYNYWIGPGNNGAVVRRVLNTRDNWVEVAQNDKCHFRWAQSQRSFKYQLLSGGYTRELVNHFQHHSQLSDKSRLIRNLNQYCQSKKSNMFELTPPTFIIDFSDIFCDKSLSDFLSYYSKNYPRSSGDKLRMEYLYHFKSLISGTGEKQKPLGNKYSVCRMEGVFVDEQRSYLWLLKPTSLNRGRGVRVFSELNTLKEYLREYMQGFTQRLSKQSKDQNYIKTDAFVIQKYIQRPMLIQKRKFDIRTWALVDHSFNLYFFSEGYVRMSSETYDSSASNINNPLVHLTNNAVQKHGKNYCKFESGNQLSFAALEKYIRERCAEEVEALPREGLVDNKDVFFQRNLKKRMKQIVLTTMTAARHKLNPNDRKFCMQLFGYDFLIDQKLKVWLIECNTNPCIQQSSGLLKQLIPRMLDDAFKLTIDVLFPRWNYTNSQKVKIIQYKVPVRTAKPEKFRVSGYEDDRNLWQPLGCLKPTK